MYGSVLTMTTCAAEATPGVIKSTLIAARQTTDGAATRFATRRKGEDMPGPPLLA